MASLDQLHRAWHQVAENRIRSAQEEGEFDELAGMGRPLEEFVNIDDPNGWIRRLTKKLIAPKLPGNQRLSGKQGDPEDA